MISHDTPANADPKTLYSFFTNEYTLTKEICAETEPSRLDIGIALIIVAGAAIPLACILDLLSRLPEIPALLHAYFSSSSSTVVYNSQGGTYAMPGVSLAFLGAAVLMIKSFPRLVGEKRFKEQLKLVPSEKRCVNFYDQYVEIRGKFSKKIPYRELMRTGQTRSLYLLFFTERRIVILHKAGFCKGTLPELKAFISKRRTLRSRLYGILRWLPVVLALALMLWVFSSEY